MNIDKTPHKNTWFLITEKRRILRIEWRIPGLNTLADFIYWAHEHGAEYDIVASPKRNIVELIARSGTAGEYQRGLLCPLASFPSIHCYPYRTGFVFTHRLLHHGLDGIPTSFYRDLFHSHRDAQVFLMSTKHGAFTLSPMEWVACLSRGTDTPLYKLGVQIVRKPEKKNKHEEE